MLVDEIALVLGAKPEYLIWLSETASKRYKIYQVRKRSGGFREIAHPSKQIKPIQKYIAKRVFEGNFPIHVSATAYKRGASIKSNAQAHVSTNFTLRMDFNNFFPSFTKRSIASFLRSHIKSRSISLDSRDIRFISSIVTRNGSMPIGAPSSPTISNVMMYDFDCAVSRRCAEVNQVYTRYADDIFISSFDSTKLGFSEAFVREEALPSLRYVKLKINDEKTAYLSRRYRRSITGVIITPDRRLSIGRARKREISSLVHSFLIGVIEPWKLSYLVGLINYCNDVEPRYLESLRKKYGEDIISRLKGDLKSL